MTYKFSITYPLNNEIIYYCLNTDDITKLPHLIRDMLASHDLTFSDVIVSSADLVLPDTLTVVTTKHV